MNMFSLVFKVSLGCILQPKTSPVRNVSPLWSPISRCPNLYVLTKAFINIFVNVLKASLEPAKSENMKFKTFLC